MIPGGLLLAALAGGCKAPLFDMGARFDLADTSWFAEEQTLFVFYELAAEQGLNEQSVIEITYTTDDERLPWTALADLPNVHTHVPVDCGPNRRCGSASLSVPLEPRDVELRFRYHRDGELALDAATTFNVVSEGPPYTHRSLIPYGVFDETNQLIQWRARHQFPTIRNDQATALGLRRQFMVRDPAFGTERLATATNPYGYGVTCPDTFVALGFGDLETEDRAVFSPDRLPLGASDASTVCADVFVTDATGTFAAGAIAQKNPEVRPAFPVLRSPIRDAAPLRFFLGPCDRTISEEHEAMQRQRLQLEGVPTTCIDDWDQPGFVADLVVQFRDAVEAARPAGRDMVLVIALNQDERGAAAAVEEALALVVPPERHRTTPRLAGAFVLDSDIRGMSDPSLSAVTLWCPSTMFGSDVSASSCAILPVNLNLELGPFTLGTLPILPPRDQYLTFIDTYSVRQAGEVTSLAFRVPEFAATTDHIDLGDFGVVTFLNQELISAAPDDAFSYCTQETADRAVFQSEVLRGDPGLCEYAGFPPEYCEAHLMPLELLPDWHRVFGESDYGLGIFWEFPFLMNMDYEVFLAGSVTAFGFSVPFGVASSAEANYGSELWASDEYVLRDALTQCDRFCDHPTFDSAGVYHVTDPFVTTYAHNCYLPEYPTPGDSGFPLDP